MWSGIQVVYPTRWEECDWIMAVAGQNQLKFMQVQTIPCQGSSFYSMQYGHTHSLIADLLGSWFTGNLDIVLQFGLSAAGPKCKYTSVLQSKCNQLTTRVYWQYLQCDIHSLKTLKIDLILLLTLLFSELLLNLWRGVGWGKAVPKLWLYNNILGLSKTISMGC